MSSPRWQIRPLGVWDRPITKNRASGSQFRAKWDDTLKLLLREVDALGGGMVVFQVDATDAELRRDGMLRARARVDFPGVKVSFDSRHGPLTYASDAYEQRYYSDQASWQVNVRAIALALVALRAVDRYGISSSGEQYRGWAAITGTGHTMSRLDAANLMAAGCDVPAEQLLTDPAAVQAAYRALALKHHPDVRGGDADLFARLTTAREVLEALHG